MPIYAKYEIAFFSAGTFFPCLSRTVAEMSTNFTSTEILGAGDGAFSVCCARATNTVAPIKIVIRNRRIRAILRLLESAVLRILSLRTCIPLRPDVHTSSCAASSVSQIRWPLDYLTICATEALKRSLRAIDRERMTVNPELGGVFQ